MRSSNKQLPVLLFFRIFPLPRAEWNSSLPLRTNRKGICFPARDPGSHQLLGHCSPAAAVVVSSALTRREESNHHQLTWHGCKKFIASLSAVTSHTETMYRDNQNNSHFSTLWPSLATSEAEAEAERRKKEKQVHRQHFYLLLVLTNTTLTMNTSKRDHTYTQCHLNSLLCHNWHVS